MVCLRRRSAVDEKFAPPFQVPGALYEREVRLMFPFASEAR